MDAANSFYENNQSKPSSGKGSGRGGVRPNSGRKRGSATIRTREVADRAAALGVSPLAIMLLAMGALVDEAKARDGLEGAADERLKMLIAAAGIAKDAAPYMHPRLAAIEHTGRDGVDLIPPATVVGDPAAYYAWLASHGKRK